MERYDFFLELGETTALLLELLFEAVCMGAMYLLCTTDRPLTDLILPPRSMHMCLRHCLCVMRQSPLSSFLGVSQGIACVTRFEISFFYYKYEFHSSKRTHVFRL